MATIESLRDDGEVIDPQTVRFKWLLPGPIERVWAYLTEPDKRAQWFAGGPMELREGGRATLFFQHKNLMQPGETAPESYKKAVEGLTHDILITQCEAPRLLGYMWGEPAENSEVVFELEPQGGKVLLTLTHRKLRNREEMRGNSGGWHLHLTMLQHVLEGTQPPRFWDTHAMLEEKYKKIIP